MVNEAERTSENYFSIRVKHQYTAAQDMEFDVDLIEATHTVEVTPDSPECDSWLITMLATGELRSRGIDVIVQNVGDYYDHSFPKWKLVMVIEGTRYPVKIVEVHSLSNTREFTVIFSTVAMTGAK